jgi:hypothetical protein
MIGLILPIVKKNSRPEEFLVLGLPGSWPSSPVRNCVGVAASPKWQAVDAAMNQDGEHPVQSHRRHDSWTCFVFSAALRPTVPSR